jgi:phosphatidylglycerol:prolipoprotein diacylglycerol transferase
MFTHPQFDPVAIHLAGLSIHWYGIMYLIGFLGFIWLGKYRAKHDPWRGWNAQMVDDAIFYGALGVIIGGRMGYVLFYQTQYFMQQPLQIFAVWQGGMSFHGGFIGVLLAMGWFAKKYQQRWLSLMDFVAPLVPLGLGAGRLGNFINGELWGRPTDGSWGMVFPQVDTLPRHPSQLYEFALEGLLLFVLLWLYSRQPRRTGAVSALFLIGYGGFRWLVEFTRQPDAQLGLLSLGMSMGQWLSLPMLLIGIWLFWRAHQAGR